MKLLDWIIWGLIIIIIAIVILSWQAAYATREQVDLIQQKIKESNAKIGSLDIAISVQKTVLSDTQKEIAAAKENIRQVKKTEGKSWDFIPSIKAADKILEESVQKAAEARSRYLSLLREKSDEIKNLKSLKLSLELEKDNLQIENKTGYSDGKKIILIQLSDKCLTALKNQINTTCPSYFDLRNLDTSLEKISGKLRIIDGFYQREKPVLKESWRYYDHDYTSRVVIDPPGEMADRYPLIKIESNFDTYLQTDSHVMQQYILVNKTKAADQWGNNGTYNGLEKRLAPVDNFASTVIYHDRFVDKKCNEAIINSDKGMKLLLDTIKYLQSGCTETEFDTKEVVMKNYTAQDITTSQKYKDEQRLKWIIQNCLKVYGSCKT